MRAFSQHVLTSLRPLVTTNYVMNELVALLTSRSELARGQIITFVNSIKHMAQLHIIHIDSALDHQAWTMLEDKNWSPVDAASFVVMRQFQINEAFTGDHHFTQAGFVRLPEPA